MMNEKYVILYFFVNIISNITANDVLGCGGFIKSHVQIDFSKVVVKLLTKQGLLKDQTNCAPNNGYYFIPLYDKGDYILQLEPPPGWSLEPTTVNIAIDGKKDICTQGKDINFLFKGFGITGRVESLGSTGGPSDVEVQLKSSDGVRTTTTTAGGNFFFTPVYPGQYTVSISHPRWKIIKKSIDVKVTEGNSDLPVNSLIIGGYDVRGYVKSEGEGIKGATLILYAIDNGKVDGCDKSALVGIKTEKNYLCHVVTNEDGLYEFPMVSTGNYYIVPFYKGQNIHFEPTSLTFSVGHESLTLNEVFEGVGFSVPGRVLSFENGKPLAGATIYLNGQEITKTKSDGTYMIEKIKAGTYVLTAKADNLLFEEKSLKVNPSILQLPEIFPSSYFVCGTVVSENSQIVTITRLGSTHHLTVSSEANTGKFCEYLRPGKYQLQVIVTELEKSQGIQFFPISQTVEVTTSPISGITFSQLKATILGKIQCMKPKDCDSLKLILRPVINDVAIEDKDAIADVEGNTYMFDDIRPGTYEVIVSPNRFCWAQNKHIITVTSATLTVPTFVQSGYEVIFTSSHDTKLSYKTNQGIKIIELSKGRTTQCVQASGTYNFNLESCHTYETNTVQYNTDSEMNKIYLSALKHKNVLSMRAKQDFGDIFVTVNTGGVKSLAGPVSYKNNYKLDLFLNPSENAILIPQSDTLYFNPPILSINGDEDCVDLGIKFEAVKGRVFKGKVIPALEGVQVSVVSDNSDTLMDETDSNGNYKFPPLDDSKSYTVTAVKDSYVLVGPDEEGNFLAHKLAEIIVEVLDHNDNKPLQGALLSLSGGQSYRSNLQTNELGKITFHSLTPSEYFLRPMMKEYSFEPNSKIIDVKEGATVTVQLRGKRVAYSAFGQVTSLNGEPEGRMIVIASGTGNCSQYSEESTSEINGQFRIRGLHPYCSYSLEVKGSLDDKEPFERAAPSAIVLHETTKDIDDLKLIIFRPPTNTDILVKVYTTNPDHYRSLRVKVSRESPPSGLVHTTKIDSSGYKITNDHNAGILLQLPSITMDNKLYSVQLESSISKFNKVKPPISYFTANSSFKYVDLDFVIKTNVIDQQIKQTSVWTLAFIFCSMLAAYNIDKLVNGLKESLSKVIFDSIHNFKSKGLENNFSPDTNDIDQIVQSINATKRKVKPKKI